MGQIEVTESLLIDADQGMWLCRNCEEELIDTGESYKKGCLVSERDPTTVHRPIVEDEYTFAPDPDWCRIVEFYCPDCGSMIENEYLPPGHPITDDIRIDVSDLAEVEAK